MVIFGLSVVTLQGSVFGPFEFVLGFVMVGICCAWWLWDFCWVFDGVCCWVFC